MYEKTPYILQNRDVKNISKTGLAKFGFFGF